MIPLLTFRGLQTHTHIKRRILLVIRLKIVVSNQNGYKFNGPCTKKKRKPRPENTSYNPEILDGHYMYIKYMYMYIKYVTSSK